MLGGKAIVHRQDGATSRARQFDIAGRIHFGAAHDESAAVDVQQRPCGSTWSRPVQQAADILCRHLLDADIGMCRGLGHDRKFHHCGAKAGQRFGAKVYRREPLHQWPERRIHILIFHGCLGSSFVKRIGCHCIFSQEATDPLTFRNRG